jgi:hypothetical protein
MKNMSEFPKKCIKCKREDLPLKDFVYARSIMSRSIKTSYIRIPVCEDCEKDFNRYEKLLNYLKIKYCVFCIFTITTFISIAWSISTPFIDQILITSMTIIAIVSGIILTIFLVIHLNLYKRNPGRINNYIEIKMDGSILVKDPEYKKEYEELQAAIVEDNKGKLQNETFYCPRCRKPQKRGTFYCRNCGKDLKEFY